MKKQNRVYSDSSVAKWWRNYNQNGPTRKGDYTPSLTKADLESYGIVDIIDFGDGSYTILTEKGEVTIKEYQGYKRVCLKNKQLQLHRVIYAWFCGNIPRNMIVDHIDNDKTNNTISNLQLLTRKENVAKNPATHNQYGEYNKYKTV